MKSYKHLVATLFIAGFACSGAYAEGQHTTQVDINNDHRVVLSIQIDGAFLQGTDHIPLQAGTVAIHGMVPSEASGGSGSPGCSTQCPQENEGGTGNPGYTLVAEWGEADVLIDCGFVYISLYRIIDGQYQEVFAEAVNSNYCPQ